MIEKLSIASTEFEGAAKASSDNALGDPRFGRRNHAMILLLTRLGLRAPQAIAIQLDDIDWRAGELIGAGGNGMIGCQGKSSPQ